MRPAVMRGTLQFMCTMVSICVNYFRAKFAQNWHEIHDHSSTCVLACGCECEFCANFARI